MDSLKNILQIKTGNSVNPEKAVDKRGPRTSHQLLALEIAESFGKTNSRKDISILMGLCKKYNEQFIRRVWGLVNEKDISNKMAYFLAIIKNINTKEEEQRFQNLKILFIGTSNFSVPTIKKIIDKKLNLMAVITQPDRPAGRKKIPSMSPVKNFVKNRGIRILQPEKITDIADEIRLMNPGLIVMVSYGQIIPKEIIEIPKYGCINIHPSILPKYRGSSPIQTAILNGDKQTGVSIMMVDEKMDHGDILKIQRVKIENKNYTELHDELSVIGADLLLSVLPSVISQKIKLKKQDDKRATYTKMLVRSDGRIDWSKKVIDIERQIRAFYPWPGTFAVLPDGRNIKVKKASIFKKIGKNKDVGKIVVVDKKIIALCGTGSLILEVVQPDGKNEMQASDFILGNNVEKLL